MKTIQFKITLLLAITLVFKLQAQITNVGEVTVAPNTVVSMVSNFNNTNMGAFYNDGDSYVYANFNNDGIVDFYSGGLTRFVGNNEQTLSGLERSYLYDAEFFNNTSEAPFHLSGTISVAGESDFNSGIIDNDNYGGLFVFEQEANHINTSNYSHVDGTVLKEGNTSFVYPIGDNGYYRFAAISEPDVVTDGFDAKYYLENSNLLYSHENRENIIDFINDAEYWEINRPYGNSDVLVSLSWSEETTPAAIHTVPQEDNIVIVRWDNENELWVNEGGLVDANNKTVTANVTGYGVFTLARLKAGKRPNELPCGITVYNAVSSNSDGTNDFFRIENINSNCTDNLQVKIFNRWGVEVYKSDDYGKSGNIFTGYSEGRLTQNKSNKLPTGTYYYILKYNYTLNGRINTHKTTGYLYLTSNDN